MVVVRIDEVWVDRQRCPLRIQSLGEATPSGEEGSEVGVVGGATGLQTNGVAECRLGLIMPPQGEIGIAKIGVCVGKIGLHRQYSQRGGGGILKSVQFIQNRS